MRTARTFGVLLAFPLVVVWGGAVGCKNHSDCEAIAVGTPLASLPHVWGPPDQSTYYGCYQHQDIVYAKGNPIQVGEAVVVGPAGRIRVIGDGRYLIF